MQVHETTAPDNWANCVAAYFQSYGTPVDASVATVLGAGAWLELRSAGGLPYLSGASPVRMESLSSQLQCVLSISRQGNSRQLYWLCRRSQLGKKTLILLGDGVLDHCPGAAPGLVVKPLYAVVERVHGTDDLPADPDAPLDEERLRAELDLGGGTTVEVTLAELRRHWLQAGSSEYEAEWYTVMPRAPHASPRVRLGLVRTALTKQYHFMRQRFATRVAGTDALARLLAELDDPAAGPAEERLVAHLALLRRSFPRVAAVEHPDMGRGALAAALRRMQEGMEDSPLEEAAAAYQAASDAWLSLHARITGDEVPGIPELRDFYTLLLDREESCLRALEPLLAT